MDPIVKLVPYVGDGDFYRGWCPQCDYYTESKGFSELQARKATEAHMKAKHSEPRVLDLVATVQCVCGAVHEIDELQDGSDVSLAVRLRPANLDPGWRGGSVDESRRVSARRRPLIDQHDWRAARGFWVVTVACSLGLLVALVALAVELMRQHQPAGMSGKVRSPLRWWAWPSPARMAAPTIPTA